MRPLSDADRHDAIPAQATGTAVLLLAGSSGRVERERAEMLADRGARVAAIRWFGGDGQRPTPHEVPIELFIAELDGLRADADHVAIVGTSFGAEAALVTATLTAVDAVVAIAPSSVVWGGLHDEEWSSHWTFHGAPLPWVPFDPSWSPSTDPPSYRGLYEQSLRLAPSVTAAARIRAEEITGEVLLIAGGDDQVWPSERFAAEIEQARITAGRRTTVITHPHAGHRLLLPGEEPAEGGIRMARGGRADADAELGQRAWPELLRVLRLRDDLPPFTSE